MLTFIADVKQVCFQVDQDFNGVGVELCALGGKVQFFVAETATENVSFNLLVTGCAIVSHFEFTLAFKRSE